MRALIERVFSQLVFCRTCKAPNALHVPDSFSSPTDSVIPCRYTINPAYSQVGITTGMDTNLASLNYFNTHSIA